MTTDPAEATDRQPDDAAEPDGVEDAHDASATTDPAATDPADGAESDEKVRDMNPAREAAKWRTRFRDAEAENAKLSGQLEALRRRAVEDAVGERLTDPSDLWRYGTELDQLLDESGAIDDDRLRTAVDQLVSERPYLSRQAPPPSGRPTEDLRGGTDPTAPAGDVSWNDVLHPRRQ